jgi:hypothetical protein
MPIDIPSGSVGVAGALLGLTAAVGQIVNHLQMQARKTDRARAEDAAKQEVARLSDRLAELTLSTVRAEGDRQRLNESLSRLDSEVAGLRGRLERQGVAVEADLRPLRESIQAMHAILSRGGADR